MNKKNIWIVPIIGTLVIFTIFAGCTTTYPTSKTPQITITQPQNGATIPSGDITITVNVKNFTLVNQLGGPSVSGQGHIHYFMDVSPPTTPGQPAVTAAGTYAATINTSYTWQNVPAGSHTFSVELVNNDHTPLNPAVVSTITVTVQNSGTPSIQIIQPQNGATLTAGNIAVTVQVSNFNLVNKLGQANVAGEGHIIYFFDVSPPTTPGQQAITSSGTYAATVNTSYTWKNVTAGMHTFSVELVNNDHTPLQPPATANVMVTVSSSGGQSVAIYLRAYNIAFNLSTITVPAGAQVTVHFTNDDSFQHNFAVYDSSTATRTIFKGAIVTGPASTTYNFTAPSTPGTYFFRCDIHPTQMYGNFVVT